MPNAPIPSSIAHAAFAGKIGVARRPIDPPVGIYSRNWGAAKHDVATGRHKSMTLTALTLQENAGGTPLVLIAADLGWWRSKDSEWRVRGPILKALELDPARLVFNLSHTHSGPSTSLECSDLPGGHLIEGFIGQVVAASIEAVRDALKTARLAELAWTTGSCDLAKNRDLPDPERPRVVCGYNPAESADATVLVGRVSDAGGRVLATLVNYACHPVTLAWQNTLLSPDYVGAMRETVETQTKAPCIFLQGCSGELAPAEEYTGDTAIADANGRRLGFAALAALEGMLPPGAHLAYSGVVESGAPLATWTREQRTAPGTLDARMGEVEFEVKPEYPALAEIDRQLAETKDRVLSERLRRKRTIRQGLGDGSRVRSPYWIWRMGDAYLFGQPMESYSWLQTEIRRRFPNRSVVAMNLVNGSMAYLPPAGLYGLDLYQVWQTPFDRGCLERMFDAIAGEFARMEG
jgi:hypothetical protein